MQAQSDLITAILWAVSGALILTITAMIVHAYNRILNTQDAFLQALSEIKLEQVEQAGQIANNKEHVVRLERIVNDESDAMADKIVTKLKAAGGW